MVNKEGEEKPHLITGVGDPEHEVHVCVCVCVAAVVLDCVNMAPSAGKVTPRDAELVAALERRFPALPARGALFQQLNDAKFDVSGEFSLTAVNQTLHNM